MPESRFSSTMAEMIARSRPQQAPSQTRTSVTSGPYGMAHQGSRKSVSGSVDVGALMKLLGYKTPEEKKEIGQKYSFGYNTASEEERIAMHGDSKIVQTWDMLHKAGIEGFVKGETDEHARPILWSPEERQRRRAEKFDRDDYIAQGTDQERQNIHETMGIEKEPTQLDKDIGAANIRESEASIKASESAQATELLRQQNLGKQLLLQRAVAANENLLNQARLNESIARKENLTNDTALTREKLYAAKSETFKNTYDKQMLLNPIEKDTTEHGRSNTLTDLTAMTKQFIFELGPDAPDNYAAGALARLAGDYKKELAIELDTNWSGRKLSDTGKASLMRRDKHVRDFAEVVGTAPVVRGATITTLLDLGSQVYSDREYMFELLEIAGLDKKQQAYEINAYSKALESGGEIGEPIVEVDMEKLSGGSSLTPNAPLIPRQSLIPEQVKTTVQEGIQKVKDMDVNRSSTASKFYPPTR